MQLLCNLVLQDDTRVFLCSNECDICVGFDAGREEWCTNARKRKLFAKTLSSVSEERKEKEDSETDSVGGAIGVHDLSDHFYNI